ncbi:3-hydroxyacyl-CoA dehydrogenase [Aureobasidium pullulans]|uniref:3-hydroxyacyl-CoA dehydrogenase n=1 Tax=Aureobasidium pullulans TaxID=5580 RepID=A0A4S9VFI8_AURPU|nr:3-hydroxyacyl-CoA dehydrogenase [Aureobasidium pullulans]
MDMIEHDAGYLPLLKATCWCSTGYNVVIRDINQKQCDEALQYISENVAAFAIKATTGRSSGTILELKIDTFAELERLAPKDCILASNSSSYKSSEMIVKVNDDTKTRILNCHYMMPPVNRVVELMTDGHTFPELIQWLSDRHAEAGLSPYIAVKESTGFIFNRIWAAIKRECLMVLAEGVSTPEQLDKAWMEILGCSFGPCMSMDSVGLDTVALIEKHYIKERGLGSEFTVDYLQEQYLDHGKLGMKSDKGGLYPRSQSVVVPAVPTTAAPGPEKRLVVLDMGLGQPLAGKGPAEIVYSGRLLEVSLDGKTQPLDREDICTIADKLPECIDLDYVEASNTLYWTDRGEVPFGNCLYKAQLDDQGRMAEKPQILAQNYNEAIGLKVDAENDVIYVTDLGGSIWRCGMDGSDKRKVLDEQTSCFTGLTLV